MSESNIIDINSARKNKIKTLRILDKEKEYKISGSLAIILVAFAKFILKNDPRKSEMEFIGFVNTITKFVKDEKFEEV